MVRSGWCVTPPGLTTVNWNCVCESLQAADVKVAKPDRTGRCSCWLFEEASRTQMIVQIIPLISLRVFLLLFCYRTKQSSAPPRATAPHPPLCTAPTPWEALPPSGLTSSPRSRFTPRRGTATMEGREIFHLFLMFSDCLRSCDFYLD